MINVLQIIVHMPLFSINFPANAQYFFSLIIEISNFDFMPSSWVGENFFAFLKSDPINDNAELMGYSDTSIILNLQSLFVYILLIIAVVFCTIFLWYLTIPFPK